jgi:hypothetical protein
MKNVDHLERAIPSENILPNRPKVCNTNYS